MVNQVHWGWVFSGDPDVDKVVRILDNYSGKVVPSRDMAER
jgi:hypothetical protein